MIQASDRAPRWKPPSTGSRQHSGHPLPAHERAARLLVRIELLPTPERGRMALQNAPNMVQMGSPEGQRGARIKAAIALPPTPSGSGEADVLRAPQVQHAIEHVDGDVHLG